MASSLVDSYDEWPISLIKDGSAKEKYLVKTHSFSSPEEFSSVGFSFIVPSTVIRNTLFIHVELSLEFEDVTGRARRRRRVLRRVEEPSRRLIEGEKASSTKWRHDIDLISLDIDIKGANFNWSPVFWGLGIGIPICCCFLLMIFYGKKKYTFNFELVVKKDLEK